MAFIDDDVVAAPDRIERLLTDYDDPRIVGVGGQVVPDWQTNPPAWLPTEFDWTVGCAERGMPSSAHQVLTLPGANMSFLRTALADAGGFGAGARRCQEAELCVRVASSADGSVLVYDPDARVLRTVPRPQVTWRSVRSRCFDEGLARTTVTRLAAGRRILAREPSFAGTVFRALGVSLIEAFRGQPRRAAGAPVVLAGAAATSAGFVVGQCRNLVAARSGDGIPAPTPSALGAWATRLSLVAPAVGAPPLAVVVAACPVGPHDRSRADLGATGDLLAGARAPYRRILPVCQALPHQPSPSDGLLLALIGLVYATPAVLSGTLRYSGAWRHVAVVDYIAKHGSIHSSARDQISTYQAWPGFYAFNALLSRAWGFASAISYASWVPAITSLAMLGPLALIVGRLTTDRRLVWATAWVFLLANWVGQDYFSPLPYTYFLYLTAVAVCFRWYGADADGSRIRPAVAAVLITLFAVIATSDALTGAMLVVALTAMVVFRRSVSPWLPAVMLMLIAGWIIVATHWYFAGDLHAALDAVGRATGGGNLAGAAVSRIYLLALPFVAYLAATVFFPSPKAGRTWLTPLAIGAASVVLLAGLVVSYYSKELLNHFTPAEVAASRWLDRHASDGSLIVAATSDLPFAFTHYETYDFEWFAVHDAATRRAILGDPAHELEAIMAPAKHRAAYLMPPSAVLALSGWAALASTRLGAGTPLRVISVTLFLLLCPGTVVVRRLFALNGLPRLVMSLALSTAIAAVVSEGLVLAGSWSPTRALVALAALTTAGEVAGPAVDTRAGRTGQ